MNCCVLKLLALKLWQPLLERQFLKLHRFLVSHFDFSLLSLFVVKNAVYCLLQTNSKQHI